MRRNRRSPYIEHRIIRPCQIGNGKKTMMWFGREIKINKHEWRYEDEYYRQKSLGFNFSVKFYKKVRCWKCGFSPEMAGYK